MGESMTGIYECNNGQVNFYHTPYNVLNFMSNAIRQNQQIIDYFLKRTLNANASPYIPNKNIVYNNMKNPSNTKNNKTFSSTQDSGYNPPNIKKNTIFSSTSQDSGYNETITQTKEDQSK